MNKILKIIKMYIVKKRYFILINIIYYFNNIILIILNYNLGIIILYFIKIML